MKNGLFKKPQPDKEVLGFESRSLSLYFVNRRSYTSALQIPKERLSGNLTSIGRMCSDSLCLFEGVHHLGFPKTKGFWEKEKQRNE